MMMGTRLNIPFGNKELAMNLGARYRTGGWFASPGTRLQPFQETGWLQAEAIPPLPDGLYRHP
jgi:hypothetical protein